ncbi:uncharacterized protein N7482_007896 [Penicillium canariense]|uniref:Uncharacterized protein n=1 Tax=Penicillium canariense TaxID=189055 RepID=A0A9W9LJL7_9EURO|nr:uncharacterized protein N7482_007896 [Penicillium canariense]KAJ5160892.1 hypothetical protein N7482_007896 [Penicillium canariense]
MNLFNNTKSLVKKSRVCKCWNAARAKPNQWWSTRTKETKKTWRYILALFAVGGFIMFITTCVSVGYSYGRHARTEKALDGEMHDRISGAKEWQEMQDEYEEKNKMKVREKKTRMLAVNYPIVFTETAPILTTTSMATVAMSFTA